MINRDALLPDVFLSVLSSDDSQTLIFSTVQIYANEPQCR